MPNNFDPNNQNPTNPFTQDTSVTPNNTPFTSSFSEPVQTTVSQPAQQTHQQQIAPEQEFPKDQRIVDYLIQEIIPQKNPNMPADQVANEMERLYKLLEAGIFDTAYAQLNEDHKTELDTLMKYGADIPAIQAFFIEKIPNIQDQLKTYWSDFIKKYVNNEI